MIELAQYMTCGRACYVNTAPADVLDNARELLGKVNALLAEIAAADPSFEAPGMTSGYRTQAYNELLRRRGYKVARKSKHLDGRGIDLADAAGRLDAFCMAHPEVLERLGLWFEHPDKTRGWCHLQSVPYASFKPLGPRWFYP